MILLFSFWIWKAFIPCRLKLCVCAFLDVYSIYKEAEPVMALSSPSGLLLTNTLFSTAGSKSFFPYAVLTAGICIMPNIASNCQLLIYLICHPSWEVKNMSFHSTKKILSSFNILAEYLLFLFTNWVSLLGEILSALKTKLCLFMDLLLVYWKRLQRRLK